MFIKLHNDEYDIAVNVDSIVSIYTDKDSQETFVKLKGGSEYFVTENIDMILTQIKK